MASFQYRAVLRNGERSMGTIEASDLDRAIDSLRRSGAMPVSVTPAPQGSRHAPVKQGKHSSTASRQLIGELAVLLRAGLQIDRALLLAIENMEDQSANAPFMAILRAVREGTPLSQAMADQGTLFSPTAIAMTEAGETNGRLAEALERLSEMLEQAAELRRIVGTAIIYPTILMIVAVGVILLMLLFVIPQFENLFATARAPLPSASRVVMEASRIVRHYGLVMLGITVGVFFAVRLMLQRPAASLWIDRMLLNLPQIGELIRRLETARFSRTLGALIQGNVSLPAALILAQRTVANRAMNHAIGRVADEVRKGGGLSTPLIATGMLPRIASGFFRTGEESSQLGLMLTRLADVLDRDVKTRLERAIGILTPLITITLGMTVAGIIASVMSAILGFNDLAVAQ